MFRIPLPARFQWSTHLITFWMRTMSTDEQWNKIDRTKVDVDKNLPLESDLAALEYIRKIFENCDGALDVFGPAERYLEDLLKLKIPQMSDTINYLDSERKTYTSKGDVIRRVFGYTNNCEVSVINGTIGGYLMEAICDEIDSRLAGTYEIIPSEWCDKVGKEFGDMFEAFPVKKPTGGPRMARPNDLLMLFDAKKHARVLTRLTAYVSGNNILIDTLLFLKTLKTEIFKIVDKNPLIFAKFSDCRQESLKFPLVIRLIRDGDSKFLFAEDVEKAVRWALRIRKKNGVQVELENNLFDGRHKCISYSEYLNLLEKYKLNASEITLVNVQVHRTRTCAVQMKSPRGSDCVPADDCIFQFARFLTFGIQVFQRSEPEKQLKVLEKTMQVILSIMHDHMFHHFIDTNLLQNVENFLGKEMDKILGSSAAPKVPVEIPEKMFSFISPDRLRKELVKMRLHLAFPEILDIAADVSVRYNGLVAHVLTPQDLCMAVRDCLVYVLALTINKIGTFLHYHGFCNMLPQFPCTCRNRKVEVWQQKQVDKLTVQKVDEFSLQFDHFNQIKEVFGSLLDRKSGCKIVTNRVAAYYIIHKMFASTRSEFRASVITELGSKLTAFQSLQHPFYMTMKEVHVLAEDALGKMKKKHAESLRTGRVQIFKNNTRNQMRTATEVGLDILDCFKYVIDVTTSLTAFQEYLPERKPILGLTRRFLSGTGRFELCAHTGDVLEVVQAMLKQNSAVVSDGHWRHFHSVVSSFQKSENWAVTSPNELFERLKSLPIDLGKLHFVPEVDTLFEDFTRKVSTIIEEVQNEESKKSEEKGKEVVEKSEEVKGNLEERLAKCALKNEELRKLNLTLREANDLQKEVIKTMKGNCAISEELISELNKKLDEQQRMSTLEIEEKGLQIAVHQKKESEMEKKLKKADEIVETNKNLIEELKTDISHLEYQYGTLSEALKAKNREMDALKKREKAQAHKVQKEHRAQLQKLKDSQGHQQEKIKLESKLNACQKENEELQKQVSQLKGLLAAQKTLEVECGICLTELKGDPIKCDVCTAQWHQECIEQWVQKKATCPVCSRSLPSPTEFPPLV